MAKQAEWPTTHAKVTDSTQSILNSSFGGNGSAPRSEYRTAFEYFVSGKRYEGAMRTGTRWKRGRSFELSYDPNAPYRNSASRGFNPRDPRSWLLYAIAWIAFIALLYFGKDYLHYLRR